MLANQLLGHGWIWHSDEQVEKVRVKRWNCYLTPAVWNSTSFWNLQPYFPEWLTDSEMEAGSRSAWEQSHILPLSWNTHPYVVALLTNCEEGLPFCQFFGLAVCVQGKIGQACIATEPSFLLGAVSCWEDRGCLPIAEAMPHHLYFPVLMSQGLSGHPQAGESEKHEASKQFVVV